MPLIESSTVDRVTTITLNRPDKLNAFFETMREDLYDKLREAEKDETVRVVVITGAGRAFCSGGDVEFMAALQRDQNVNAFRRLLDAGRDVIMQITSTVKPVIAAINGIAAGAGCNLALACDYRIASDQAKLGETFARIGLHPDWGGTFLLPRAVPANIACEMFFLGDAINAEQALRFGILNRVVPDAELDVETLKMEVA